MGASEATRARSQSSKPPVTRKQVLVPPPLKIGPNAEYVTSGGSEIRLERDEMGMWVAHFAFGGEMPDVLKGKFGTKTLLHKAVVQYLQSDNVLGKARWPKQL